ncbi:hypothetical protein DC094_08280 [Pelagibaculum spongiae]|uniref:Uncharacterized protein n=2 Tax=Pelagibaculum spongiae TaxID=2080658 RepID=A0A2V1GW56_9GAMM|nr:hypothetical protein DC094_08280 [Pelagibaculum spongiae]
MELRKLKSEVGDVLKGLDLIEKDTFISKIVSLELHGYNGIIFGVLLKKVFLSYIKTGSYRRVYFQNSFSIMRTSVLCRKFFSGVSDEITLNFIKIITESYRRVNLVLNISGDPFLPKDNGGVAVSHRIWLGKLPDEDTFTRVCAAEKRLSQKWLKAGGKLANPRHILWTNNQLLMNGVYDHIAKHASLEIRNIDDLYDIATKEYKEIRVTLIFANSLIQHQEYAHACDILRILILYFFWWIIFRFYFFFTS